MYKWARKDLIDTWDNTGFQIGNHNKIVGKILVGLDLDRALLNQALVEKFDMIITHHPLIFNPIKNITNETNRGNLIMDIIKNDIVVFNAHSNLDLVDDGVNYHLAAVLGLKNSEVLSPITLKDTSSLALTSKKFGYGRIGTIDGRSMIDYISFVKDKLKIESLIVYGDRNKPVERVAVCGGSGSNFILDAFENKADVYITGDIKYHDAQLAHELGMTIFDAGHFNTERIILPVIKNYLEENLEKDLLIKLVMESGLPHKIY